RPSHGDADAPVSPPALLQSPSTYELRAQLQRAVLNDLLGPAGGPEEEVDEDRVRERYLVGMLAPRRQRAGAEEVDELALGGNGVTEDGTTDPGAPQTETLFPSSFGLTFCVAGEATALRITARWGRYLRAESRTLTHEKTGAPRQVWKRTPVE